MEFWILVFLLFVGAVNGRIHTLPLKNDERSVIVMTSFGYLKGGSLDVNVTGLTVNGKGLKDDIKIGFSLDKSSSSDTSSYVEKEESTRGCVLDQQTDKNMFENVPRAIMKIEKGSGGNYELKVFARGLNGLKFYESREAYESMKKAGNTSEVTSASKSSEDKAADGEKAAGGAEKADGADSDKNAIEQPPADTDPKSPGGADSDKPGEKSDETEAGKAEKPASSDGREPGITRPKRAAVPDGVEITSKKDESIEYVEQPSLPIRGDWKSGLNVAFYVGMETEEQIGLYELYFHNCENIVPFGSARKKVVTADFTAHIVEMNGKSYLSAGDMALPLMYGIISAMFFFVSLVWLQVLCGTKERVFKIHYLMAVIAFVKGLSVMFHSLDYYFIAKDGRTEAWAVIYYIIHLLKGVLLIICLLLIGTGWAFIKYILSNRDKKLFMIVIPMQVMVNIAYVIMEETEEGNKAHFTWKDIAILVDVLCCGAILIPVVWSIRHLQEASQTDGKAAINLAKLELFRHFYIMVVCYLYFTRIIVYLLEITLPFQYIWVHALFAELGAFVFFSVTGYKFRPGCDNPYLKLEQYDEDDPEEALTQSGATENISRVNKQREKDVHDTDEFDVLLPKQRTSKV